MSRHVRTLAIALCLRALPLAAQPAGAALQTVTTYTRPQRENGVFLLAPPRRVVPAAERALAGREASRVDTVGPSRWGLGALAGAMVAGIGVALTLQLTRHREAPRGPSRLPPLLRAGVEVRLVTVALDAELRATLVQTLARLRAGPDAATPPGLHATASALRDSLARAHASLRAAAFQSRLLEPALAETNFAQTVAAHRARARPEALLAVRRPGPPGLVESDGLAVLSIVIATRCPLPPLPPFVDTASLLAVLDALVPPKAELVMGLEVLWAPDAQDLTLTPTEAGALFPELVRLVSAR